MTASARGPGVVESPLLLIPAMTMVGAIQMTVIGRFHHPAVTGVDLAAAAAIALSRASGGVQRAAVGLLALGLTVDALHLRLFGLHTLLFLVLPSVAGRAAEGTQWRWHTVVARTALVGVLIAAGLDLARRLAVPGVGDGGPWVDPLDRWLVAGLWAALLAPPLEWLMLGRPRSIPRTIRLGSADSIGNRPSVVGR